MGRLLRKPATVFTSADYYRRPDDKRWERIDGEACYGCVNATA